jgi:hypothetical protein
MYGERERKRERALIFLCDFVLFFIGERGGGKLWELCGILRSSK